MKNLQKSLLYLLVALFAVSVTVGCEKKKENEPSDTPTKVEANTNDDVVGDKTVGVFQLTNTSLIWKDGTTVLETTITNTSDSDANLKEFIIHVKDADNNEIAKLKGFVGSVVKAHETRTMNSYHYENLSKATSIEYEIVE